MIVRVHHVQITVPRDAEAAARRFYCGVLGLTEVAKPAVLAVRGGFWLQVGDVQVHVGLEDGVVRAGSRAHVAYEVDSLTEWQERLSRAGIVVEDGESLPDYARREFRDPFGNRVELLARR